MYGMLYTQIREILYLFLLPCMPITYAVSWSPGICVLETIVSAVSFNLRTIYYLKDFIYD